MKNRLLFSVVLSAVFTIFIGGCSEGIVLEATETPAVAPPTPTPTIGPPTPTTPPCCMDIQFPPVCGIVPGQSIVEEVQRIFGTCAWPIDYSGSGIVPLGSEVEEGCGYGFFSGRTSSCSVNAVYGDDIVAVMGYRPEGVLLRDAVERYGPPEKVYLRWSSDSSRYDLIEFLIPDHGVVLVTGDFEPFGNPVQVSPFAPRTLIDWIWYFEPASLEEVYSLENVAGRMSMLVDWPGMVGDAAGPMATPVPTPISSQPIATRVRERDGMEMVYVPDGTFQMGSTESDLFADDDEFPAHLVTLDSFWIDQTEVTNAQYALCVAAGECHPPGERAQPGYYSTYTVDFYYENIEYENYPVVNVSWSDADTYCEWAGGRLPTEAEWEYAARGEEGYIYPWGNRFEGEWLDFCDANCGAPWNDPYYDDGYVDTAPVGSYENGASWVGALDMAGNAWEWIGDWYSEEYPGETQANPIGSESGEERVVRGGSWIGDFTSVRTVDRLSGIPTSFNESIGFRCVVSAGD